jgi:hypothetical protein
MGKNTVNQPCTGIPVLIIFLAIIAGLILFLGKISANRFEFERLVVYSILIIFGITLGVETCLFRRLRQEEAILKQELERVRKEINLMKK